MIAEKECHFRVVGGVWDRDESVCHVTCDAHVNTQRNNIARVAIVLLP